MKRHVFTSLAVIGLGLGVMLSSPTITLTVSPEPADSVSSEISIDSYGNLPLYFEENNGQTDAQVRYFARTGGYSVFFTNSRIAFNLVLDAPAPRREAGRPDFDLDLREETVSATPMRTYGLYLDFVGANPSPALSGESLQDGITSYFRGGPDQWVTAVPHFGKVRYTELYPGIDAVFYGSARQIQYDFIVAPGADPSQIQLQFDPVESIGLADNGDLRLSLGDRVLTMNAPYTYQTVDGVEREVESRFVVDQGLVTFDVGEYDASLPLVIDPVIVYAGYIGGSGDEHVRDMAVDSNGSIYLVGWTTSTQTTLPEVGGPDLTYNGGTSDVFVAKVNAAGTHLDYAGFIGGNDTDEGYGIAVDGAGNAYVTGRTRSTEASFPVLSSLDPTHNGGEDSFIVKINSFGTGLVYAGFIGGPSSDTGYAIALGSTGSAYVVGHTGGGYPVTQGPDQTYNGGPGDATITKIDPTGTALIFSGYIGGDGDEYAFGIAVDSAGSAYITGSTNSSAATFPDLLGPDLSFNGGAWDGFVVKVNVPGTALVYAGYIGGIDEEYGTDITVDANGSAYATGFTYSTEATFPVLVGPDLTHNGGADAFVVKVSPSGSSLVFAGYIGGASGDFGNGVSLDAAGNIYVAGPTGSTETSFPVVGGLDLTQNGMGDGFISKLDSTGASLIYSGFVGGAGNEGILAVANAAGDVFVAGDGNSTEATFPVTIGPDLTYNGGSDVFVAKLTADDLVQNAGFEIADSLQLSKAQDWKGSNLTNDKRKCNKVSPPATYSRSGKCAFLFKGGAGESSKISQTIKPDAGTLRATVPLTVYAWIDGAPNYVLAKVVAYYTDGSRQAFSALMGPSVGYTQFTTAPFFLAKDTSKLKVSFQHTWTSGKLYLDDVVILTGLVDSSRSALLQVPEPQDTPSGWRTP